MLATHVEKTVLLTGGTYFLDVTVLDGAATPLFTIDFLNVSASPIQIEWPASYVSMNATGNYVKASGRATLSLWSASNVPLYVFVMTGDIVSADGVNSELAQHIQDGAKAFMNAVLITADGDAYMKPEYFNKTLLIWPGTVSSFSLGVSHLAVANTPWFSIDIVNLNTTPLTFSKPANLVVSCSTGDRLMGLGRCTVTMFGANANTGQSLFYAVITGDMVTASGLPSNYPVVQYAPPASIKFPSSELYVDYNDTHRNKVLVFPDIGDVVGPMQYTIRAADIAYTAGMELFEMDILNLEGNSPLLVSGFGGVSFRGYPKWDVYLSQEHFFVKPQGRVHLKMLAYNATASPTGPIYWFNVCGDFQLP